MIHVIGSINLDLIATVGRLPEPGETVSGISFMSAPGGKGANQALAAARAGAKVRMTGATGRDAFAGEAMALLREGGVDLSGVETVDESTGTALIFVSAGGENVIVVVAGANSTVSSGQVDEAAVSNGDIVLLQHEIPLRTVESALDTAIAAGAISVLNTAPFDPAATAILHKADLIVANETEFDLIARAMQLGGIARREQMADFVSKTARTIIVTRGGEGVISAGPDGEITVPAVKIDPVDTVGAGDTFCGYLVAGLASGKSLDNALKLAAAAGSLACLKSGAQPAIPFEAEVADALAL